MGPAAAWMLWSLLALALVLGTTAEEGLRRHSSGVRFEREVRRAGARGRTRMTPARRPDHVRLVSVEVVRSVHRSRDDAA